MRDPDDYELSDIYESKVFLDNDAIIEEALISRAPKQQGFLGEVGTRLFNRLGSKTANYKKQIMDEYHRAWAAFIKDWKSNKRLRKASGMGNAGYPVSYILNFLKQGGVKDANKVATKLGYSAKKELDRIGAGNLIFKCIQNDYFLNNLTTPKSPYKITPLKTR